MKQDDEFYILPIATILSHLKKSMGCSDLSNFKKNIITHIAYNQAKASQKVNDSQVTIFIVFTD